MIDIRRMNARELCEHSMSVGSEAKERKFVNGLGLGKQYNNITGNPSFDPNVLKALAKMVKDSAITLKDDYETKEDLQQAIRHGLFEYITNPIMESFAHRVWNGSDLSDPPPGRPTKLQYTDEEDKELYLRPRIQTCIHSLTYRGNRIAKNLFCWVCRKFSASFNKRTNPTNTQTEPVPLPEPPSETTIRGLRPYITREPGRCWISCSTTVGNEVDPPLDLPTNASFSVDRDQGRDKRAKGKYLSGATGSSSKLGLKRKHTADNDDDVTDYDHYMEIWRFKPGNVSSQLRVNNEHDTINQLLISAGADFVPPHNEENTPLFSYTSHGLPPTPKSRGARSHNIADGDESGTDSTIEHCLSPPLSPLHPGPRDHNVSRASSSRAIATVGIPATEEAIENNTPPGTPTVTGPTTEATAVEEPTGDTVAPNSQVESATVGDTTVETEQRTQILLLSTLLDWLVPEKDDDKTASPKQALQLIQVTLNEESQRLRRSWKTHFESYHRRLKGWTDFALAIERVRDTDGYRGTRERWLDEDLMANDRRGLKRIKAFSKAQVSWHSTYPGLQFSEMKNGLGCILRDVVIPDEKHPKFVVMGSCLEELVKGFNQELEAWFKF
jgi:hypothetical protein